MKEKYGPMTEPMWCKLTVLFHYLIGKMHFIIRELDDQVKMFNETLTNIFRNYIPHKIIKCNYKDPPWITIEFKTNLKEKKSPI